MALADLLSARRDEVMRRWRARVTKKLGVGSLDVVELEDDMPRFIDELARVLRTESEGYGADPLMPSASEHGAGRLRLGFDIAEVVREYGVLHVAILDLALDVNVPITDGEHRALVRSFSAGVATAVAEHSRRQNEALDRQATEHLAFVAHELRNPLMTAQLSFGALRRGALVGGGTHVDIHERSLRALQELIDSELVRSRLRRDATPAYQRIAVAQLIADCIAAALPNAEAEQQTIVSEISNAAECDADRKLLAAALTNLIRNAIKFTRPNGTIVVRARALTGGRVCIDVEDECGGFAEGQLDELFNPFVQAGTNRSGFGLGLAIAKQAIEAHAGTIHVRNLPNKGCVFTIDLPCRAPVEASRPTERGA